METEDLSFYNSGHRYVVKEISEHFPYFLASKFLLTFLIESIDLSNSSRFMVSSGEVNTLGISDFQSNKKGYSFNWVVASIYEIAHEEIVSEGEISPNGEEFDEVMKLSMDVSADGDRGFDRYSIILFREDGCSFFGDQFDLLFCDGLKTFEVIDDRIDLHFFTHFK